MTVRELRVPALEVRQGPRRTLYSFAVDGKLLPTFAAISRVKRDATAAISGYQRPEVLSHIAAIRRYLESEDPMLPNALVIAFDSRVRFEASTDAANGQARTGVLIIPVDISQADNAKPGWIVDGQQRTAAIRDANVDSFPVCVTAFITDSEPEQRSQFILVNSTKPLPKGLIYELLPSTQATLPFQLERRRLPAYLADRLNHDHDSPLNGMIRTPTSPGGLIKDNSILRSLENSLSDGALYRFRDIQTDAVDAESMVTLLKDFWSAVAETFARAWGLPPKRSRLMHGVGVMSLGFIMDATSDRLANERIPTASDFREDLEALAPVCHWTDGFWNFGPDAIRRWNELQNTTKDIQMLANYLLIEYRRRVLSRLEEALA